MSHGSNTRCGPESQLKGKTTEQMRKAPHGALYLWVNGHLGYPKQLAKALGREDLRVISPRQCTHDGLFQYLASRPAPQLIVDHAARSGLGTPVYEAVMAYHSKQALRT